MTLSSAAELCFTGAFFATRNSQVPLSILPSRLLNQCQGLLHPPNRSSRLTDGLISITISYQLITATWTIISKLILKAVFSLTSQKR